MHVVAVDRERLRNQMPSGSTRNAKLEQQLEDGENGMDPIKDKPLTVREMRDFLNLIELEETLDLYVFIQMSDDKIVQLSSVMDIDSGGAEEENGFLFFEYDP